MSASLGKTVRQVKGSIAQMADIRALLGRPKQSWFVSVLRMVFAWWASRRHPP
jgi:hypothetical protein